MNFAQFLCLLLLLLIFLTATGIIYTKQQSRNRYQVLSALEQKRDAMLIEWGKLQLEHGTLTEYNRVEELARNHLQMSRPSLVNIVFLRGQNQLKSEHDK